MAAPNQAFRLSHLNAFHLAVWNQVKTDGTESPFSLTFIAGLTPDTSAAERVLQLLVDESLLKVAFSLAPGDPTQTYYQTRNI